MGKGKRGLKRALMDEYYVSYYNWIDKRFEKTHYGYKRAEG